VVPGADGKFPIIDVCPYCQKHDPYFKEPAVIQNHIKNKCKMLTNCVYCKELVEAPELKDHWLRHCKQGPFSQCQRCKEVLPEVEYLEHAEKKELLGLCSKLEPGEVRCSFCEEDIMLPGIEVSECWKEHLMKRCLHNPRRNPGEKQEFLFADTSSAFQEIFK